MAASSSSSTRAGTQCANLGGLIQIPMLPATRWEWMGDPGGMEPFRPELILESCTRMLSVLEQREASSIVRNPLVQGVVRLIQ